MRKLVLVIAVIIVMAAFAGCLGGDADKKKSNEPELMEASGTTGSEGSVETLAQASPETASETVEIIIPDGNVTSVAISIKVSDDDDGTNPDQVSGTVEGSGGVGNYNATLPNGPTPYTATVNFKAGEEQSLPNNWIISLSVECHASQDNWPGPIMWVGTADNGFSYNVTFTYKYLKAAE
jgi:hypothetical protein